MYDQIIGVEWKDMIFLKSEWVNNCCLTPNSAIFQQYHGETNLIFNEMMMRSALY
jgi:hypothetical protein